MATTQLSKEKTSTAAQVGHVIFDEGMKKGESNFCRIECEDAKPPRGIYVSVDDPSGLSFVGRIIDGPFYTKGSRSTFYALELTAMMAEGRRTAIQNRPQPGSLVTLLDSESTQEYLSASGDLKLGRLLGQPGVDIYLDSASLTRHIGIFGTTGSGKSNTLQVIVEQSSKTGRAVLIFDIEGEYVRMHEPTEDLIPILSDFGEKPEGVKDLHVYVPPLNTSLNPDAKKFGIPFADLDLDIFADVLDLTPFERVYLLDIAKKTKDSSGSFHAYDLNSILGVLRKRIEGQMDKSTIPEAVSEAHMGLFTKLSLVERTGVIDAPYETISPENLCAPGRITVIDVGESSDLLRNLCVAHFLRDVFRYKTRHPQTTPLMLFVEEIHTFISKGKSSKMLATITMLTEMARQGRKRGLGLGIVSQQPALLPSELIELCNTRFVHKVGSMPNLQALRHSTGNVPDSLWALLPSLGKGETLIASPKFQHAIVALIRPNKSKRLRVEFGG
jgi:DNA helicase HerA-like ATPase